VEGTNIPNEIAPRFITREAYDAIVGGELNDDGTLVWKEKRYALADTWDGIRLIARLAPLDQKAS
jgi:Ser-tRNA(Ala) deacylase AlaX